MSIDICIPPNPHAQVLAKIDQVYYQQRHHYHQKKLKTALRHRRRLVLLRAAFQHELDRALSSKLQSGLGITVYLDEQSLTYPRFIAQFDFAGQQWVLTCQRKTWGCDWFFTHTQQSQVTCCTQRTLEAKLCYSLGQYRNRLGMMVPRSATMKAA
ncbi:MAG: hypothetical protein HC934_01580 [Acaryochloridaceae cyanobacterium SU_2_1]|nr:hypothetical protein [Acaryochloridaceae cyanobacterium SU_2_1]